MNGASRKKGWTDTESVLKQWLFQFECKTADGFNRSIESGLLKPNLEISSDEQFSCSTELDHVQFEFQTTILNPEAFEPIKDESEWINYSIGQVLDSSQRSF